MIDVYAWPDPARYLVRLEIAGGGVSRPTITAYPAGRPSYEVRVIGQPTGDPLEVLDYEAPFGVPITYRVVRGSEVGSVTSDPLNVAGCILSSTSVPGSARPVRITRALPNSWEPRSAWFDVIGRRDPVVAVAPMRYRAGEWDVYARGNDERLSLLELLTTGAPLLLRTGRPEVIDDAIALVTGASESPLVDETGGRVFTIRWQAVTRTLGPYAGASRWTYAVMAATRTDYAEVLGEFLTYRDLYAGPADVDPADAAPETLPVST